MEELADDVHRSASAPLRGAARDALTRASGFGNVRAALRPPVGRHGDDAYINLVVSLYPALVAPLSYALQSSELNGVEVADHLFWATSRVLTFSKAAAADAEAPRLRRRITGRARLHDGPRAPHVPPARAARAAALAPGRRTAPRPGGRRSRTTRSRFRPTPRAPRTRGRRRRRGGARRGTAENCRTVPEGRRSVSARICSLDEWTRRPRRSSRASASSGSTHRRASGPPGGGCGWRCRLALSHCLRRRRGRRDGRRGGGSGPRPCPRAVWPLRSAASRGRTCSTGAGRKGARPSPWRASCLLARAGRHVRRCVLWNR